MNFNVNAPEFVPRNLWKLPCVELDTDQNTTGSRHLVSKEPLEKSKKKKVKKNCEFCKRKGQSFVAYSSHQMQDSKTEEILCPVLKETMYVYKKAHSSLKYVEKCHLGKSHYLSRKTKLKVFQFFSILVA